MVTSFALGVEGLVSARVAVSSEAPAELFEPSGELLFSKTSWLVVFEAGVALSLLTVFSDSAGAFGFDGVWNSDRWAVGRSLFVCDSDIFWQKMRGICIWRVWDQGDAPHEIF